jgi:prepilin-type processing-associated H-X9-DG protein
MCPKESMNQNGTWLKKPDAVVTVVCIVLAFASLGAVGEGGRRRAKEAVCQSNLAQWGTYFQDYIAQNDGKFYSGFGDQGYYWPWQLPHDVQDWKANRTWLCPIAAQPITDEQGFTWPSSNPVYRAWGIYQGSVKHNGEIYALNPNGIAGSFGLNGYVLNIPLPNGPYSGGTYQSGVRGSDGWHDLSNVPNGDAVPMFLDCLRFEGWPVSDLPPGSYEGDLWSNDQQMRRFCISRHEGAVNGLFVDGSMRKVGLKELWTLKWHRAFDTTGPWTKAGGVQPEDWPEWIRPFKDY